MPSIPHVRTHRQAGTSNYSCPCCHSKKTALLAPLSPTISSASFAARPFKDLEIGVGAVHIFTTFTTLRTFSLIDVGELALVQPVFAALQPDNAPDEPDGAADAERLVCAKLRNVYFDGITPSVCTLDLNMVTECLTQRAACLGSEKAFEILTLVFEQESEMIVAFWEAVAPLVHTLQLSIGVRVGVPSEIRLLIYR